ncbi:hypothetical protein BD311DRAFT_702395 [Dichomitus squalens]|uniref:SHSP domain-containing protein n=1 Tax=Dichomitus squalens TaxID=114155 RepID=A0A4Q9MAN2_9APHY|nr:hypothetical protein BD311DRAFT_702395 [Dichomitus squalens]
MTVRSPRSKFVSGLEKRLGRALSAQETLRLAAYARAVKIRKAQQQQQRVYKPRMELWDDGDSPLVTAVFEVPGLRPEDITVDVVDGRLVVSGERRQQDLPRGHQTLTVETRPTSESEPGSDACVRTSEATLAHAGIMHVRELKYGLFRRIVAVPAGCTTADLQAVMENGMLTVSWPRDTQVRFSNSLLGGKAESALGLDTGAGQGGLQGDNSSACV